MSEALIELIVRCVFALAIVIYAILNKTSLSSVVKEIKEVTSMYKIRNKDGSITVVSEPTENVSEVVAAEPVEDKTAKVKATETVEVASANSIPIAKAVEPVKEETALEKAEKLIDSLIYKIRNKYGPITIVTEPTETVSEVVTAEPVKEETALEKAEKLVDSLTNEEAKQLFNIITAKLFK